MISEERAEAAVEYLRDCAKEYGRLRGSMEYCAANLRRVKSLEMVGKPGSVGEREAQAYSSDAYLKAMMDQQDVTMEYETIRALREAAVFTIETWRSQASAKKQGIKL